jgi:hypothetical protein
MRRTCTEDERRRGFIWRGVVVVDAVIVATRQGSSGAGLGLERGFLMYVDASRRDDAWLSRLLTVPFCKIHEHSRAVRLI